MASADGRNILDHVGPCSASRAGGRREKGSGSDDAIACDGATHLLMKGGERIPCFSFLACAAFALPIKLSLSHAMIFLCFSLLILYPVQLEGE